MTGVLLFGPPAVGKDTLTAEMRRRDGRFRAVPKVKCGTGRVVGYRIVDAAAFADLRAAGRLAGISQRYGNWYAVDRHDMAATTGSGCHPVLHTGRLADLDRLTGELSGRWLAVLLWCDRATAAARSRHRGDRDGPARLAVWDSTRAELAADPDRARRTFCLGVRTDRTDVATAADLVIETVLGGTPAGRDATRGVGEILAEIAGGWRWTC